ncbi:SAM-dependent methyltransferase [Parafrankia discariae]|uniref:SAM-dependent methyltransferase n=1 Tax=Parafrankia discariae TaxID=365528 RepID=UPI0009762882|nr:SAM-dependent methyltransferase [Parafrankia discariae]
MCNQGVVPIVLAHARALFTGTAAGRTAYLDADLRDPEAILASAELRGILDLTRPVALSLIAILHFFPDADDPAAIVRRLTDALPAGSFLIISHGTGDIAPEATRRVAGVYNQRGIPFRTRSRAEVTALVPPGLELAEPGLGLLHRWRPDTDPQQWADEDISAYALVARKPQPDSSFARGSPGRRSVSR